MWGNFFQIYQDKMWGGGVVRVSQLSTHPHNTNFPLFWQQNAHSEIFTTKMAYLKFFWLPYRSSVFLRLILCLLRQTSHKLRLYSHIQRRWSHTFNESGLLKSCSASQCGWYIAEPSCDSLRAIGQLFPETTSGAGSWQWGIEICSLKLWSF